MIDFKLPVQAYIDKFIPKNKFFEKTVVNSKLKDEFVEQIQKITWKYKLAESTIGVPKTDVVEEIQIFELQLKQRIIPKNILKLIDKVIPYPILYIFSYKDDIAYGISYKDGKDQSYYTSDWNEQLIFDFHGINLEKIYQNIIVTFISNQNSSDIDFKTLVTKDSQIKSLQKEVETIRNKVKNEKQFNKKVETNKILLQKQQELKQLSS